MGTKTLNRRQVRWAQFFSDYNFKVYPIEGKANLVPDILSRRLDFRRTPEEKEESQSGQILVNTDPKDTPREAKAIKRHVSRAFMQCQC